MVQDYLAGYMHKKAEESSNEPSYKKRIKAVSKQHKVDKARRASGKSSSFDDDAAFEWYKRILGPFIKGQVIKNIKAKSKAKTKDAPKSKQRERALKKQIGTHLGRAMQGKLSDFDRAGAKEWAERLRNER